MAFSGSLPSLLAPQPSAGRPRQASSPAKLLLPFRSSNGVAAARAEGLLLKRPDVPVIGSAPDTKQQRASVSQSQQPSGQVAARPRSALEQASFATNLTLTQRMEDRPGRWGLSMSGLGGQIQRLSKMGIDLSRAAQNEQADLSKLMPASNA